jgi:hypothetical protein
MLLGKALRHGIAGDCVHISHTTLLNFKKYFYNNMLDVGTKCTRSPGGRWGNIRGQGIIVKSGRCKLLLAKQESVSRQKESGEQKYGGALLECSRQSSLSMNPIFFENTGFPHRRFPKPERKTAPGAAVAAKTSIQRIADVVPFKF